MRARWEAWWFGPEQEGRAPLFRLVFFAVLALDCWLNLPHLARYGAGHFNVSHVAWLDAWIPAPRAAVMVAVFLVCGWLALRVAFGVSTRSSLTALAVLYALAYFGSQLDSYQHHYLVAVLLGVLAAATWLEGTEELPDWGLKLTRVLLAIMYFWAAITKMDPLWLDGRTLQVELTSVPAKELVARLADALDLQTLTIFAAASVAAMVLELVLPLLLLTRRLRWLTCLLGVVFHATIELIDFRIGLFSYYMVGIYLSLMLPDALLARLPRGAKPAEVPSPALSALTALVAAAAIASIPVEGSGLAAFGVVLLALPGPWPGRGRALAQGGFGLAALVLFSSTDLVRDYWKYKGGDARRRGDLPVAVQAYQEVTVQDPTYLSGWVRLGDLYLAQDRLDQAETAYLAAQELEPQHGTVQSRLRDLAARRAAAE